MKKRKEIILKRFKASVCSERTFVKETKTDGKSGLLKLLHMFSIIQNELLCLAESHGKQRV